MVESCGVCKFGSGHLQEASRGTISRWLKSECNTDIAEKTRCSVLEAQEANGNIMLTEQLKLFEESSEKPVTGLASPPGMYMCVYTLHCSEYLPMVVSPFSCVYVYIVHCPTVYT